MPPVTNANPTIESASVLGTRCHPYDRIVLGNQLKTANITDDFTQFEPETNPMPANGKVGNPIANLTIESVWHWLPDAIHTIESYRYRLPSATECHT